MMKQHFFQNKQQRRSEENLQLALKRVKEGEELDEILESNIASNLKRDFERYEYEKKLTLFKKELDRYINISIFYDDTSKESIGVNVNGKLIYFEVRCMLESRSSVERKKKILQKLVSSTETFIATGNIDLKKQILFLETEIWPLLSFEMLSNYSPSIYLMEPVSQSKTKVLFFLKKIRRLIGRRILGITQDLRSKFRSIIKFLFKNMDDESADQLAVFTKIASIRSQINFTSKNGHFTYNSTFKRAA